VAASVIVAIASAIAVSAASSETDLASAVKRADVAAVRSLIQKKAAVNAQEPDGTTPLHWAARAADPDMARILVAAGAEVNARNRYGVTPLSVAARAGNFHTMAALLEAHADPKLADASLSDGQTLLMLAARTGKVDAVQSLVRHGADVNAHEQRMGTTALMWAAIDDRAEAVQALVAAGADLDARSRVTDYPHTPPGVVGDKVEEGASYVGQTVLPKGGWTALMYAARQGSIAAVRALADAKADLNARDEDGTSALIFAIINGHYAVATVLVEKGADPNLADRTGATPLYSAVDMHTMATTFGRPDLTPAAAAGSVDAIKMLLSHGADPNRRLSAKVIKRVYNPGDPRLGEGSTAFMRAAKGGDVAVMRLLLKAGADPALAQKNGNTPIILAAGFASNRSGNNPDHGTEDGALEAIKLCLELGLDINATNAAGDTAVHTALSSPRLIQGLADAGARLDIKNKQGRTPIAAAIQARETPEASLALLRRLTGDYATQPAGAKDTRRFGDDSNVPDAK
jgi:ankyrin repeat protein